MVPPCHSVEESIHDAPPSIGGVVTVGLVGVLSAQIDTSITTALCAEPPRFGDRDRDHRRWTAADG